MNRTRTALSPLLLLLLAPLALAAQAWHVQPTSLATRWTSSVTPTNAHPEYPRPQMVRPNWQNLNGLWEYAITAKDAHAPTQYAGSILVPYPVESALSGVKKPLLPDQLLWYRRTLHLPAAQSKERTLLHFGAVDYEATVYLNDKLVGMHSGGYQSFTFDITDALTTGDNELVVKVFDPSEQGPNPHGKQNLNAVWMTYTPSSGIWQTVWIERVPSTYVETVKLTPDVDRSELRVEVQLNGPPEGYYIEATALSGKKVVDRKTIQGVTALKIKQPRLWSPDDPYLYDLQLRVLKNGEVIDSVKSYFGLRKVEVRQDAAGHARLYLNNRDIYSLAVVDQGYWPDGLYSAPTDAALMFDVQAAKALGFNTIRKHLKLEPQRWYYHCDRLGVMVWQDMPTSKNDTPEARMQFEREMHANLSQLHGHPSITSWVLFNEGWGAYNVDRIARDMKQADPSRVVNAHSGPMDHVRASRQAMQAEPAALLRALGGKRGHLDDYQETQFELPDALLGGEVLDLHYYPGPKMLPVRADRISILGEHGSFGVHVEGHVWDGLAPVGRAIGGSRMTPQEMLKAYSDSIDQLQVLNTQGLSGSGYFETFDVEGEHQGFITYDREVAKVPIAQIERLNAKLVSRAKNYASAIEGFTVSDADWTPESDRYANLVSEFEKGRHDRVFLRRLAMMSQRQNDQARATEAGNLLIASATQPYTRESWAEIMAVTRTTNDHGFELLRTQADAANSVMGPNTAQRKVLQVIGHELVIPYFQDRARKLSWQDFESSMAARYGDLGSEAVRGAWMMDALVKNDWASFGSLYTKYYETALGRSPYLTHSLSYRVLEHVNDAKALEMAVRVMKWQIDAPQEFPVLGRYDPIKLDTYAQLLYKLCRTSEAMKWQREAVTLSDGRDVASVRNLEKMKGRVGQSCAAT